MKQHFCPVEKALITYKGSCNWCDESDESMIQDEIIEMAEKCGIPEFENYESQADNIVRFAALVAAREREAIAQSLDKQADLAADEIDRQWAQEMAAAVRARGEQA
jgi:hypothetical protein